jgi:hypothetical protein
VSTGPSALFSLIVQCLADDLASGQIEQATARIEGMKTSDLRALHWICHDLDKMADTELRQRITAAKAGSGED